MLVVERERERNRGKARKTDAMLKWAQRAGRTGHPPALVDLPVLDYLEVAFSRSTVSCDAKHFRTQPHSRNSAA